MSHNRLPPEERTDPPEPATHERWPGREDDYRVELDAFAGPLDLLLYLVRKQEVALTSLSLATLTEQYLAFLDGLDELDLERAGDYLVMAAQLLALKARSLLPETEPESEEPAAPLDRDRLVEELLAYRSLKEQAKLLGELEEIASRRHARSEPRELREIAPRNVDLWDLVTALQRLEQQLAARPGEAVLEADETPLAVYVEQLRERLAAHPDGLAFSALFGSRPSRPRLVATFLALLELIRLGQARAEQGGPFGEIRVRATEPPAPEDDTA